MLTIRMGAAHYDITTADGQRYDLAAMTKGERNKARRLIVGAFRQLQQQQKGNA